MEVVKHSHSHSHGRRLRSRKSRNDQKPFKAKFHKYKEEDDDEEEFMKKGKYLPTTDYPKSEYGELNGFRIRTRNAAKNNNFYEF